MKDGKNVRPRKGEDPEERKERAGRINKLLAPTYPDARCSLDFATPFQLYVATVLSAQCTDERVNKVTPELFRRYPGPRQFLELGSAGLEKEIQSTGFFRNKTKSILGGCVRMVEAYGGEVPRRMEDLLTIPGVGRKTANVILGSAFGAQEGIVVDTHVGRLSQRLGLTNQKDPVKIEQDLMPLFPRKDWTVIAHRLILHGRSICTARAPKCTACGLLPHCPFGRSMGSSATKPAGSRKPPAETIAGRPPRLTPVKKTPASTAKRRMK